MSQSRHLSPLKVYVLPISGGALVAQLAFLIEIYNAQMKVYDDVTKTYPNLVMGSSGGNISAYIAMTGGWSEAGIIRIAKMIDRDMFIMNWWPPSMDFMPTSFIGIFKSSLYRPGYGVKGLFNQFLTPKRAQQIEIWTGTYNVTKTKAQFFCNKKEGTTYINQERFEKDRVTYDSEPLTFTNGDLDLLAEITVASASIPVLVQNQHIRGNKYADGGTAYSSPLSVFSTELLRIVTGDNSYLKTKTFDFVEENIDNLIINKGDFDSEISDKNLIKPTNSSNYNNTYLKPNTFKKIRNKSFEKDNSPIQISPCENYNFENLAIEKIIEPSSAKKYSLQLVYFSCYDLYTTSNTKPDKGLAGEAGMTIQTMINSLEVLDRSKSIEIIKALAENDNDVFHIHYPKMNTDKLAEVMKELSNKKHYVLNLYPNGTPGINLIDFDTDDVIKKIREVQQSYGAHIWYIE